MRAKGRMYVAAAAVMSVAMFSGSAGASATVDVTETTVTGGSATVKGTVSFPAITTPQSVMGANAINTDFASPEVSNAAGANLTDAKIVPIAGGLRFIWELTSLPAQIIPEFVRYTWSFKIGERQYQLQAKRSNMLSLTTAEDPINHVNQFAAQKNFFQLRGACVTNYFPPPAPAVAGCYHLAFLNGSFDIANKTVSMDLPYETRDQIGRLVAPEFKPGVVLQEQQTAGSSITANFQAVISNTTTSDYINGWDPYYVGGRVQLGVGNHTSAPEEIEYGAPVALNGNSFTANIGGLSASANTIFARACNGTVCSYDQERVVN